MNLERLVRVAAPAVEALTEAASLLHAPAKSHPLYSESLGLIQSRRFAVAAWLESAQRSLASKQNRKLAAIDARLLSNLSDALLEAAGLARHLKPAKLNPEALERSASAVSEAVEATRGALRLLRER
jgi:hypothetical protein